MSRHGHGAHDGHDLADPAYWEQRYTDGHMGPHGRGPTPYVVRAVTGVPPGRALEVGCGEGVDTVFLAEQGWRVTGLDVAPTALHRARDRARAAGVEVDARVELVRADAATWSAPGTYDLVCSVYAHPPLQPGAYVRLLAGLVAPGGRLLLVAHQPVGEHAPGSATHAAGVSLTAAEAAALLDAGWQVGTEEAVRGVGVGGDRVATLHDTVLLARR